MTFYKFYTLVRSTLIFSTSIFSTSIFSHLYDSPHQLSTVNCQLSTVHCPLSIVNCQLSTAVRSDLRDRLIVPIPKPLSKRIHSCTSR